MPVLHDPMAATLQADAQLSWVSAAGAIPNQTHAVPKPCSWLISERADFWLASAGASGGLLAALAVIAFRGDREWDWLDLVFSELHIGATYGAIMRRRLWRRLPTDVLIVPLIILVLTYTFTMRGHAMLLTSITMYAAVWHRGRQSLGVARFYQRGIGGPVSWLHNCLFRGAIYLPMMAALLAYTHLAPADYEGKPYFALNFGAEISSFVGFAAALWVIVYLTWTLWRNQGERLGSRLVKESSECFDTLSTNGKYTIISSSAPFALGLSKGERRVFQRPASANQTARMLIHPGEWWVVLAHAVAFGSGYALGASNASFLLVLAVHHEVQYLYFAYATARRPGGFPTVTRAASGRPTIELDAKTSENLGQAVLTHVKSAASFLLWPVIGFAGAIVGGWVELPWLAPLGIGGLFCHYWLDGRIWTRRSFQT
jgi:hypothetical protein